MHLIYMNFSFETHYAIIIPGRHTIFFSLIIMVIKEVITLRMIEAEWQKYFSDWALVSKTMPKFQILRVLQ